MLGDSRASAIPARLVRNAPQRGTPYFRSDALAAACTIGDWQGQARVLTPTPRT